MALKTKNITIRFPTPVYEWIVESAKKNHRSLNKEIVFWIRKAIEIARKTPFLEEK